jgi:hypothetical protein
VAHEPREEREVVRVGINRVVAKADVRKGVVVETDDDRVRARDVVVEVVPRVTGVEDVLVIAANRVVDDGRGVGRIVASRNPHPPAAPLGGSLGWHRARLSARRDSLAGSLTVLVAARGLSHPGVRFPGEHRRGRATRARITRARVARINGGFACIER